MSEVFFIFENTTYQYDTDTCKLYELADGHPDEVRNHEVLRRIRYHGVETTRETALKRQPNGSESTSCRQPWH
jgi:hypothetical protein